MKLCHIIRSGPVFFFWDTVYLQTLRGTFYWDTLYEVNLPLTWDCGSSCWCARTCSTDLHPRSIHRSKVCWKVTGGWSGSSSHAAILGSTMLQRLTTTTCGKTLAIAHESKFFQRFQNAVVISVTASYRIPGQWHFFQNLLTMLI